MSAKGVENMAKNRDTVDALASEMKLSVLARIPRDSAIEHSSETGKPLPEHHKISRLFRDLAGRLTP